MKENEEMRLKSRINESTLSTAIAVPLSHAGKAKRRRLRRKKRKPTPPRCARQPLPKEGACVDTPSFPWKEVPRRGGGWMEGSGILALSEQIHAYVGKQYRRTKPSPRGEGGERSEPDRVLAV